MKPHVLPAILAVVALASCAQKVGFSVPSDLGLNAKQDIDTPVVSTLLVIDNSDSMRDEQEALAAGFRNVFDALHSAETVPNVDFYLYTTSSLSDYCERYPSISYCSQKPSSTLSKNAVMLQNTTYSWLDPITNQMMSGASFVPGLDYSAHSGFGLAEPATTDHTVVKLRSNMSADDFEAQRQLFYNSILAVGTDGDLDESGLCTMGRFLLEKESVGVARGTPLAAIVVSDDDEITVRDPSKLDKCVRDTSRIDYKYTPDQNSGTTYYKYNANFSKQSLSFTWHQSKDATAKIKSPNTRTRFTATYSYIPKNVDVSYQDYADKWTVTYYPDKCKGDNQYRNCTAADAATLTIPAAQTTGLNMNASQACSATVKTWLEANQSNLKVNATYGTFDPSILSCSIAYTKADTQNRGLALTPSSSDETDRTDKVCDSTSLNAAKAAIATDRHLVDGSCKMNRTVKTTGYDFYNGDFATYGLSGKQPGATGSCTSNSALQAKLGAVAGSSNQLLTKNQTVGTTSFTACSYLVQPLGDNYSGSYTWAELGITAATDPFNASKLVAAGAITFANSYCKSATCVFTNFNTSDTVLSANDPAGVNVPSATSGACTNDMITYAKTQSPSGFVAGSCTYTVSSSAKSCPANKPDTVANVGVNQCNDEASLRTLCGISDAGYKKTSCDRTAFTNGTSGKYTVAGNDGSIVKVHQALMPTATSLSQGIQAKIKADYGARQFFMGAIVNNKADHATGCDGGDLADKGQGYIDLASTQGSLGYVQSICVDKDHKDYSETLGKLEDFIIKRIVPSYSFKAKATDKIQSVQLVRNGSPVPITEGTDYVISKQVDAGSDSVLTYKITFLTKGEDDASVLQKGDAVSVKFLAIY